MEFQSINATMDVDSDISVYSVYALDLIIWQKVIIILIQMVNKLISLFARTMLCNLHKLVCGDPFQKPFLTFHKLGGKVNVWKNTQRDSV